MKDFRWKNIMKHRNVLYGICALWIVFFHVYNLILQPQRFGITQLIYTGNMGVDVFLLLSAIGLSFSVEKNTIFQFYKNRIKKVLIPFVIMSILFYIWQNFRGGVSVSSFLNLFLDVSTLSYWVRADYAVWYASFIIVMYALYPFLYKLYKHNKYWIILLIVLSVGFEILSERMDWFIYTNCERALSRIPIFLIGLFLSDDIKNNKKINGYKVLIFSLIFVILLYEISFKYSLASIPLMYTRYGYGIMALSFVIVVGYIIDKLRGKLFEWILSLFKFIGSMPFEIYVIHVLLVRVIKYYSLISLPYEIYYLIVPIGSAIVAFMYKKIIDWILNLNDKK